MHLITLIACKTKIGIYRLAFTNQWPISNYNKCFSTIFQQTS